MWSTPATIYTVILCVIIFAYFAHAVLSTDRSKILSPITIISLVYIYYCVVPFFTAGNENYSVGPETNIDIFHGAALLSYCTILVGFYFFNPTLKFKKWNNCFNDKNILTYAVVYFIIAFIGYSSFRGFHFSIFSDDIIHELNHDSLEHYFIELIYLHEAAFALFLMHNIKKKGIKWYYLLMIYVFIIFIFAGTRARLVILFAAALTSFYLYPKPKRVNYLMIGGLLVIVFLFFSVMDQTRQYSKGLNREALATMSYEDIKSGPDENAAVYWFSAVVMDWVDENGQYVYFEPIVNAVLSPIPRSVFPWKPGGEYLMESQNKIIGTTDHGAIFLNFTEGYYSFGWLGVILYGLIFGWLSKVFWVNYKRNQQSIGAILALALYNGLCYNLISRGYLATSLINFIYIVCLPFWIARVINAILKQK